MLPIKHQKTLGHLRPGLDKFILQIGQFCGFPTLEDGSRFHNLLQSLFQRHLRAPSEGRLSSGSVAEPLGDLPFRGTVGEFKIRLMDEILKKRLG